MTPYSSSEFDSLVEAHRPAIYRFLVASVRDEEVAESLTQECFLKAFRNRSNFRGQSSARTWLMRIAINLKTDFWRSRRIQFWRETQAGARDLDLVSDHIPSGETSPEAQLLAREQTALVWRAVETLSPRERSVFLLRCVEELRLREIGECTGLKVGAVKVYLRRALTKIRGAIAENDKVHGTKPVKRSQHLLRQGSGHEPGSEPGKTFGPKRTGTPAAKLSSTKMHES